MTRPVRHPTRALALAALLAGLCVALPAGADDVACLRPSATPVADEGGLGGTGIGLASGGIGGTGQLAAGGIGGTGALAGGGTGGTGIVGAITGFASVCVNGLEVHYDASTPLSRAGKAVALGELALGQVLAIDAQPGARGLTARRMAIVDALVGPVTALSPGRIEVMGQALDIDQAYVLDTPTPGATLRVAGFRDAAGRLRATRLERIAPDSAHAVLGTLTRDAEGQARLDGLPLADTPNLADSMRMLALGRWDGSRLRVARTEADPTRTYLAGAERIVVEGIAKWRDGRLSLAGYGLEVGPGVALENLADGQRARVSGRPLVGDRLLAERIEGVARVERPPAAPAGHPVEPVSRDAPPPERPPGDRPASLDRPPRPERLERPEPPARPERLERPPLLRPEIMRPR